MSLDIHIHYKTPKHRTIKAGADGTPCGSTIAIYNQDTEVTETYWHANITHNMGRMADHIPVHYTIDGEEYSNTLYELVWRPEEVGTGNICNNTDIVSQALESGIAYMVTHRNDLLPYNPSNGWGSYDSFLQWLITYWQACLNNPDCQITPSR